MEIDALKKAFEEAEIKKISMNINKKTLEVIDDLTKIFETTRTQTIAAIIMSGLKAQTNYTEKTWKNMKKDKNFVDKKRRIEQKLRELEKFKKKWKIDMVPS